jgi:hypothetical protein
MSKTLLYPNTIYPNADDFVDNSIFRIEDIILGDYNTISSRNYNRTSNYLRNNNITGFNKKKYKMSSHIPMIHDTLSYYHLHKDMNATFKICKLASIDTTDLMLMRQLIDKKQRYDSLLYNPDKYRKPMSPAYRFEL